MNSQDLSLVTHSPDETRALGWRLGLQLAAGDVVTLEGPLGAGKTTLVQGIGAALGLDSPPTSPTFVLIVEYLGRLPLLHLDAYRLHGNCYDELRDAGALDMFCRDDAVKLIEWPDRVIDYLPQPRFAVEISFGPADNDRRIEVRGAAVVG